MNRSPDHVVISTGKRGLGATALVLLTCLITLATMFIAGAAEAQERPELPPLQLQRFRLAPGPGDYLTVFGTTIPEHLKWHASIFADYADDPMQISTMNAPFARTVDFQLHTSLMGSIALYDVVEIGLSVPLLIAQRSGNLQPLLPAGAARSTDLQSTALGDWRLSAKYQLMNLRDFPIGLALITALSLPIGHRDAFGGDGGVGAEAIVAADYVLFDALRLGANLGYRYRYKTRQIRETIVGDEISWGLAAHTPFPFPNLDALVELAGGLNVARKGPDRKGRTELDVPIELRGALRYRLVNDWTLTGGFGSGLTNGVGAPNMRVFVGMGGQWVTGGWFDVDYATPGFRGTVYPCEHGERNDPTRPLDVDGCPIAEWELARGPDDGQIDRLLNVAPTVPPPPPPEPPREPPASDRVQVTERQIIITEQVHFATGKDEILSDSFPILDDIVYVLEANPHIELLRIEGHTDSVGRESMNLDLSRRRAASVMRYLVEKGIPSSRLQSEGYGPSQPIEDNSTPEGRAKNRRVEFTILKTR